MNDFHWNSDLSNNWIYVCRGSRRGAGRAVIFFILRLPGSVDSQPLWTDLIEEEQPERDTKRRREVEESGTR